MPCPNGATCPSRDGHIITDYHKLNLYQPLRIYTPTTKQELVAAIIEIESRGQKAKAMGSNMSFSAVTRSDQCVIETIELNKHLSLPRLAGNGSWKPERFRDGVIVDRLGQIITPSVLSKRPRLVYVEAGMKIKHLIADLDATSSPRLSLPAMGAGGEQTIAGSLATGTHGSEMDRQPLIDAIRAVHLVGPGGQEWWIERSNGFSEPPRLANAVPDWCADTKIFYDDRLFYSVIVSAGRLGVIYAMVMELEEEYWLEERRTKEPYAPIRQQLVTSAQSGFTSDGGIMRVRGAPGLMFLNVVLNLNTQANCWVMERRIHNGARVEVEAQKTPSLVMYGFCAPFAAPLIPVLVGIVSPVILAVPIVGPVLLAAFMAALGALLIARPQASFGEIVNMVLNLVPSASSALMDFALDQHDGTPPRKVGSSHSVMDQMDYNAPKDCYQGDQIEVFFNARSSQYLDYVDQVCQFASSLGGVPGYVHMRFMQQTDAHIGMEQFPMTAAVEVVVQTPSVNGPALLAMASVTAVSLGGIPHWGKNVIGVPRPTNLFPAGSLEQFRYAIALTEEGHGPTFSSQFTRDSGLEWAAGVTLEQLDLRTARNKVSLTELLNAAQGRLAMPSRPNSLLQVARQFAPSLRMNADGVPLPRGRAATDFPQVRLRDLFSRIV
jgi:hypothetical protein